jgi:nucleoporin-like protein 2
MANPIGTVFASTPSLLEPKQAAPPSNTMNPGFSFAIQGSGTAPAAVAPASAGPKSFQFALPASNGPAVPNAAPNAAPSFSFSLPGAQNPTSSFQTNLAQTNPPAYGFGAVQTQKTVFGAAPPPAYGTQTQPSVFGANQAQGAMFGASPAQPSAFGGSQIQQSFTPQIATKADSDVFSNMGDLKKEEVDQFNSQKFCMGKIPMNPPPRELCM